VNILGAVVGFALATLVLCLALAVLALLFITLLAVVRWLCRDRWEVWYVRGATYVALIGFSALLASSSAQPSDAIKKQVQSNVTGGSSWKCPEFLDSYGHLVSLSKTLWLVEHFPIFVLLPAGLVLFAGYTLERSKQESKPVKN